MSTLTEQQNRMVSAIEEYCSQNNTSAWVGTSSELDKIGGVQVLYQLEQIGAVDLANRIEGKWIITPRSQEDFPPLDIKLTGPFYVQRHPMTDDTCVYDASNAIVECFFYPEQAKSCCDELNAEYKALTIAKAQI